MTETQTPATGTPVSARRRAGAAARPIRRNHPAWLGWAGLLLLPAVLSVIFTAVLVAACLIPRSAIEGNARRSAATMLPRGGYPRAFQVDSKAFQIDGYTDATMLNLAYEVDSERPLHAAMVDSQSTSALDLRGKLQLGRLASSDSLELLAYPRYWHGYLAYVRPLLVALDWQAILALLAVVLVALTAAVLAGRSVELWLPVVAGMLLTNVAVAVQSLQLVQTYVLAMAISLWVVRSRPRSELGDARLFLIAGGVTSFFDLLSAPAMTLGLPLLFLVHRMHREARLDWAGGLRRIAVCAIAWGYAYLACWAIKWPLASAITGADVVTDAFYQITLRAGPLGTNVSQMVDNLVGFPVPVRISAPLVNFGAILEWDNRSRFLMDLGMWAVFLTVAAAILLKFRRRGADQTLILLLLVIAAIPVAWYVLTAGHAARHYWFTYRNLLVTIAALGCAWAHAVDWKRMFVRNGDGHAARARNVGPRDSLMTGETE